MKANTYGSGDDIVQCLHSAVSDDDGGCGMMGFLRGLLPLQVLVAVEERLWCRLGLCL